MVRKGLNLTKGRGLRGWIDKTSIVKGPNTILSKRWPLSFTWLVQALGGWQFDAAIILPLRKWKRRHGEVFHYFFFLLLFHCHILTLSFYLFIIYLFIFFGLLIFLFFLLDSSRATAQNERSRTMLASNLLLSKIMVFHVIWQ